VETSLKLIFSAEEVRQHIYCPRILYFRKVQHIEPIKSYKMERGQEKHEELIRKKKVDINSNIQYYYNIYLKDEDLGILALLDCLETDGDYGIPIDLKTGKCYEREIKRHHFAQLVTQAILVEMQMGLRVPSVKIYYLDEDLLIDERITMADKLWVLEEVERMRKSIKTELILEPTPDKNKCNDCEYWKYCWRS